jgi:hypothetical protein
MRIWLGYDPQSPEWRAITAKIPEARLEFDLAEQGSARWHSIRLGIPTASRASDIITPAKGDLSKGRRKYMYELVAERLLNEPATTPIDYLPHIERGKVLEGMAREEYGQIVGAEPLKIGFATTDDRAYGCSPDSLLWLGDKRIGLEIKAPGAKEHIGCWIEHLNGSDEGPLQKHRPQMQFQILTCGLSRVDFFSFHPDCPQLLIGFNPDDNYLIKLESHLRTFCGEVDEAEALMRKQGIFNAAPTMRSDAERKADAMIADPDKMMGLRAAVDGGDDELLALALGTLRPDQRERVRHAIEVGREVIG